MQRRRKRRSGRWPRGLGGRARRGVGRARRGVGRGGEAGEEAGALGDGARRRVVHTCMEKGSIPTQQQRKKAGDAPYSEARAVNGPLGTGEDSCAGTRRLMVLLAAAAAALVANEKGYKADDVVDGARARVVAAVAGAAAVAGGAPWPSNCLAMSRTDRLVCTGLLPLLLATLASTVFNGLRCKDVAGEESTLPCRFSSAISFSCFLVGNGGKGGKSVVWQLVFRITN